MTYLEQEVLQVSFNLSIYTLIGSMFLSGFIYDFWGLFRINNINLFSSVLVKMEPHCLYKKTLTLCLIEIMYIFHECTYVCKDKIIRCNIRNYQSSCIYLKTFLSSNYLSKYVVCLLYLTFMALRLCGHG